MRFRRIQPGNCEKGAQALITSCPLCAFNLDHRQKEIKEEHSDFNQIPIFYFTQLMCPALGVDKKYLGFGLNYINPLPLLRDKKI